MSAMDRIFEEAAAEVAAVPGPRWRGEVAGFMGMTIEARGLERRLAMGDKCYAVRRDGTHVLCEAVGVRNGRTLLMALDEIEGVSVGSPVIYDGTSFTIRSSERWIGRVIDGLGRPIDGKGPLPEGEHLTPLKSRPPNAYDRRPVGPRMSSGVRGVDLFSPICRGQRMGVFSGSGVGKSTMLSMFARYADADVIIIGLIGERGREVQEFLQDDLGEEGLARAIVVVATGDQPPLMRRQAAYLTLALAEHQRHLGKHVLCLIDSITRFAMAQREIGLTAGEPPTAKGYPPTVFSELPRLLERAGPGFGDEGDITGVFTVLVEGDDMNEPISDAVRGILDGHVAMSRSIAERGRFPAIDILKSISRSLPQCHSPAENAAREKAIRAQALYENMQEIIRIGAYKRGSDPETDRAIEIFDGLEQLIDQRREERGDTAEAFRRLAQIVGSDGVAQASPRAVDETADVQSVFGDQGGDASPSAIDIRQPVGGASV